MTHDFGNVSQLFQQRSVAIYIDVFGLCLGMTKISKVGVEQQPDIDSGKELLNDNPHSQYRKSFWFRALLNGLNCDLVSVNIIHCTPTTENLFDPV